MGEGADPETVEAICSIAEEDPAVTRLEKAQTMHFGPQEILLAADVKFREGLSGAEVIAAVDRLDRTLRTRLPQIRYIFNEAQSLSEDARRTAVGATPPPRGPPLPG